MDSLFASRNTRFALLVVLGVVGLVLIALPNQILTYVGGSIYLWQGVVGAGFVTATWLMYRVITGVEPKTAVLEAFLVASVLSLVVIVFNWTIGWLFPALAAVLIAYLAYRGRFSS